jgi:hypothetical protein
MAQACGVAARSGCCVLCDQWQLTGPISNMVRRPLIEKSALYLICKGHQCFHALNQSVSRSEIQAGSVGAVVSRSRILQQRRDILLGILSVTILLRLEHVRIQEEVERITDRAQVFAGVLGIIGRMYTRGLFQRAVAQGYLRLG